MATGATAARRSAPPGGKAHLAVAVATTGRFPVKVVADTLGVARFNLVE
jgi:hypothetical protein